MVGLGNLPLIGKLCLVQQTITTMGLRNQPLVGGLCLVQRTSITTGLKDPPLVGGLCLAQRTLTTKGLRDLPLIERLCLAMQTSAIMASNDAQHASMTKSCSIDDDRWKSHESVFGQLALMAKQIVGCS